MESETVAPLFLRPCAGFGNRIRAIASGLCAAEDTGRKLTITWAEEPAWSGNFYDYLNGPALVVPVPRPLKGEQMCVKESEWDVIRRKTPSTDPIIIGSYAKFYEPDRERWLTHLRSLRPSEAMMVRAGIVKENMPPNYVGVHIRRTDNTQSIRESPTNAFIEKLREFPETTHFFVASDDDRERLRLSAAFPERVHTGANILDRTSREGCREAFLDFLLLSGAIEIIGSFYSSFSEMAAAYGACPLTIIQVPSASASASAAEASA
jgi:hypothetical protein